MSLKSVLRTSLAKAAHMVIKSVTVNIKRNLFSEYKWGAPNAALTVKLKGHNMTLFEHGDLINSFRVVDNTGTSIRVVNTSHSPTIINTLIMGGRSVSGLSKNRTVKREGRQRMIMSPTPDGAIIPPRNFFDVRQPSTQRITVKAGVVSTSPGGSVEHEITQFVGNAVMEEANRIIEVSCRQANRKML